MNITITQDNSRVEVLGSNGASIIEKLYELAIDPNNTLTLEGNISSTAAYADLVSYLTTNYPDLIISAMNLYIRFEDSKAATVCSEYFGDGVGCSISNLSTASFSTTKNGVTFINALKNAGVEKFNELRYCTNITSIPSNAFSDYTTLTQIDLRNINSIKNNAFKGCTGLTSVTFSTNAYTIDYEAFENCTGLTSVDLSDITAIGKDVFRGCPNLTSVKIGPSVNKLTYRALSGMPAQPNTVLYLPLITTSAESELASISHLHYSVGSFSYNAFGQYNSQNSTNSIWGQIYLPNLTHPSAGWCAFPNYLAPLSSITVDLIYLKNISALGVGMFGGSYIKALVINSTTPPPLTRDNERNWDSFSRLMQTDGIYVPDGCESAYATAWANVNPPETFSNPTNSYVDVLSKIKPMSLLSRYATELAWITAGRPVALIEEYMS